MMNSLFPYAWEKILYGGFLLLVVIDVTNLALSCDNPILCVTAAISIIGSLLVATGHFFDCEYKDWFLTLYFIPLLLLVAGGIDTYYTTANSILTFARVTTIPTPIPHTDYGWELTKHYISLAGGPAVRLAGYLCRKYERDS